MSYVRFGSDGSDVYVYHNSQGFLHCWECDLKPNKLKRRSSMMLHLMLHLIRGDCVPGYVFADLANEIQDKKGGNLITDNYTQGLTNEEYKKIGETVNKMEKEALDGHKPKE